MRNGKCRMHGGAATGARTEAGRLRCAKANWRHGGRSAAIAQQRREARAALYQLMAVRAWCELELKDWHRRRDICDRQTRDRGAIAQSGKIAAKAQRPAQRGCDPCTPLLPADAAANRR